MLFSGKWAAPEPNPREDADVDREEHGKVPLSFPFPVASIV